MIVSCPTCSTRYTLSDESLGQDGRKVRCARCGHTWWQMPDRTELEPVIPDAPTELRPATPAKTATQSGVKAKVKQSTAPRAKPSRGTVIGFALLGLLVAGSAAGGYFGRDAVVRNWPPAALLYETIGMPAEPPGFGLELRNIRSEQKVEGGTTVLLLDGEVANGTDAERTLPPLRVITFGPEHKLLQSWTIEPSAETLGPGAAANFHHSQPDPGPVTEVTVTFGGPPPGLDAQAAGKPAEKVPEKPAAAKPAAEKHAAPAKPAGH
ncbi:zinc-ribbon domain-containing protein [Azospirillum sp. YIM B02556]|uniref:Zinc-ribbon domain-containing protein n=1 Tax=Azospirillum endophyticum TaxID=2800326 RepID=A0ABS1F7X2_9PROT|nr:MJ0042-type zinc finger domain-containing protein [Azospirillum endophyticum]MBK1839512.1 zinc-ribbon domain-containing protein [Azospirillum endophyticum]